ncbi:FAD-dependent oxidoreductase [Massilia sp. W12]|uniref:FAD-dependent oxidoreductase n=1 Tax=Massilia sp. W12 TaxID=3126507 RepID=UPI0030CBB3B9
MNGPFEIFINQRPHQVMPGQTVAAALAIHADGVTRIAPDGRRCTPVCGMGICQECRVEINGAGQQLACQTLCAPGMQIRQAGHDTAPATAQPWAGAAPLPAALAQRHYQVVVIGAGPGGQAAALHAARALLPHGGTVALVDDNPAPGGQVWRGALQDAQGDAAARQSWQALQQLPNLDWYPACKVVRAQAASQRAADRHSLLLQSAAHAPADPQARLGAGQALELQCEKLILASGACEQLLPFPGWTLQGVSGLGGLQALAKGGWPVAGKRIALAGSGPLLLAVAATLRARGAHIVFIAEQCGWRQLAGFAAGLLATPGKLAQALRLGWPALRENWRSASYVLAAHGDAQGRLQSITIQAGQARYQIACDYLACGFGLLPNTRLAHTLDCALHEGAVWVNALQNTSQAGIWCVGEACGVGGMDKARIEGRIAGLAAAGDLAGAGAPALQKERLRWQGFAARLAQAFALRPEVLQLAQDDTLICRCEAVPLAALRPHHEWKSAKMQRRCGMGACQGLVCGSALQALNWPGAGTIEAQCREPLAPCRVETLAQQS